MRFAPNAATRHGATLVVLAFVALLGLARGTTAQDPITPVDVEQIDTQRRAIEADTTLTDDNRKLAQSILDEARQHLDDHQKAKAARDDLQARLDAANAGVQLPPLDAEPSVSVNTPLPQLDALLAQLRQQRSNVDTSIKGLDQDLLTIETRRQAIPKILVDAREDRAKTAALLTAPPANDEPAQLSQCRRLRQRASIMRADAQIALLELEQTSHDALTRDATDRREEQRRRLATIDQRLARVQEVATDRRRSDLDEAERTATRARANAAEPLQSLAQENVDLVAKLRKLQLVDLTKNRAVSESLTALRARLDEDFSTAQRHVKQVGLTETIGFELRQLRRGQLNDVENARFNNRDLRTRQIAAFEDRFDLEKRQRDLANLDDAVTTRLESITPPLGIDALDALRPAARDLLDAQRKLIEQLVASHGVLTTSFAEIETVLAALLDMADRCATFVDERVLWIPSTRPIWEIRHRAQLDAFAEVARNVSRSAASAIQTLRELPVRSGFALGFVLLLLGLRPWLARRLAAHATTARHRATVSFVPTARALVDSLLLALPLPAALASTALLLRDSEAALTLRPALLESALVMLALATTREIARPNGLAEVHFEWRTELLRDLRRTLPWLAPVLVIAAFALGLLRAQSIQEWQSELGLLVVTIPAVAVSFLLARLFHPSRGSLLGGAADKSLARRARIMLFLLALVVPCGLVVLAALGYTFTALELYTRLELTLVLGLAVLFGTSLVYRWLLLSRRALAIQQARERRRILKEQGGDATAGAEFEQQAVDLAAVDQQTRRLVRAAGIFVLVLGAWGIWVDVLPALGILHEFVLWQESVQVSQVVRDADGIETLKTVEALQPITLASLLSAVIVLLATWALSRNLGGLLEIVLLRHLQVQPGERYAITTITRYLIVAIGVLIAFGTVGLGWSKVQWLIAAVSVGLGFGLQEIFANFVSGLILLFERPVRVGDLVTVGEIDGRVSKIQMRATTITDFDRKELIVPNREFITSRFVNWSLSSPVSRIVVKVGVAYGTDTAEAQRILLECARKCRAVLKDPEPNTVFRGFGESTLDLELRVFIASMDDWIDAMNEVHRAVDEAFKAAGIEIAFPQRDLHLRTVPQSLTAPPTQPPDA